MMTPMWTTEAFEAAVRRHDAQVAGAGLTLWVGSEPTYTDRTAHSPEWLNKAWGDEKEQRARRMLARLCLRFPGSLVLRSGGRTYPGEDRPRWCLGLYRRRDGAALWCGPPDPALAEPGHTTGPDDLPPWAAALAAELGARGFSVAQASAAEGAAWATPGGVVVQVRALRPTEAARGQGEEQAQASAPADTGLFTLGLIDADGRCTARIDLPRFDSMSTLLAALDAVQAASTACHLPALIVAGSPPLLDASVEWTTLTPDPAVIEVNTAPSVNAEDFLQRSRAIYATAAEEGLAPYRLYFNGAVADSGGGGQITLGGPAPQASPFLLHPRLAPRLVAFFNRHPSLSYFYSHDFVGSSGQSARADERGTDSFDELGLALAVLERHEQPSPELIWQSLAPFLCDASGNSHRAEINIEKLWNPYLADRGRLGLVEFRALRMQHTPERATALACLLRAVVAMLAGAARAPALVDWGRELHDRFALPFYLEQDLRTVLAALDAAGQGLGDAIEAELWRDEFRLWAQVPLPGCTLQIRRALEFWPLLGDSASPEQAGTSRLVDASTARLELRLRPDGPAADPGWRAWRIDAEGVTLPMRHEQDPGGALAVFGLRYRSFVPSRGLHPALGAQAPVCLRLTHPDHADAFVLTLHEWQPAGEVYPGLPKDLADAAMRRAERVTTACVAQETQTCAQPAPAAGLTPYALDLRHLAR